MQELPCDSFADGVRIDEAVLEDERLQVTIKVGDEARLVRVHLLQFEPLG